MDFDLSEDQTAVMTALDSLLTRHRELPAAHRAARDYYDHALDAALVEAGFMDLARTPGYGALEAALMVDAVTRLPGVVEAAASALVAPQLGLDSSLRPLALINGDINKPQRFLPIAKIALIDTGDDVLLLDIKAGDVKPVESLFAYPYGRFITPPDLSRAKRLGSDKVEVLRQWSRVALAVECASAMQAAVSFTVQHVKHRRQFGRALGSFQTIQHRLAACEQIARGARLLALRAAASSDPIDAATAAAYAQQAVQKVLFDVHQFNGAMGMTTEHQLHFWSYRFRALQSELGGANANAIAAAELAWGST
ncbi:MAG: acyl-CoA dehydrogenase family protein [Spongiibacteraceae bacterium]